ncbi:response regulator transcription factor [Bacillus sp. 2205SS5-2]|uniref:response regulator transcription factor n=1 Tax=Bacillus sp. 2205SS5-2 TaxID=3109031 RepID=UPI0030043242
MKAIIIDDEKHVREGLLLLAEWEKHGINTIFEAENGDEAMKLITEHQPEIIFTDMRMPKIDGINLLKWLYSSEIKSKTIVVSGYDDFEYMRNAIFYKSFDYILKPIEPDVLNETLDKAVREYNDQADSRRSKAEEIRVMNEAKPLYWGRLFTSLCSQESVPLLLEEKIEHEFGILISQIEKTMAILSIKPTLMSVFNGDTDLAFFTLSNICNELFSKNNAGVCFRNSNKDDELVILFWKDNKITFLLEELQALIYQYSKSFSLLALGQKSNAMKDAYESAQKVFLQHDLLKEKKIVAVNEVETKPLLHLLDYSNELLWSIRSGSTEQVKDLLNQLYMKLETSHLMSIEQVQLWDQQFELLRRNWLKEYEIQSEEEVCRRQDYWKGNGVFSIAKFKEEKNKEFQQLIQSLSGVKYQKEKNNMQKIEEYLQQHYQEDITLQDIADRFFLSREYISRQFKREYLSTLIDYLTNIRMGKAKKLLENPFLKIYEIAYGVGYQNEKYFSKVFKKHSGLTPNEYRQKVTSTS